MNPGQSNPLKDRRGGTRWGLQAGRHGRFALADGVQYTSGPFFSPGPPYEAPEGKSAVEKP
jgi:hypothetical protein